MIHELQELLIELSVIPRKIKLWYEYGVGFQDLADFEVQFTREMFIIGYAYLDVISGATSTLVRHLRKRGNYILYNEQLELDIKDGSFEELYQRLPPIVLIYRYQIDY